MGSIPSYNDVSSVINELRQTMRDLQTTPSLGVSTIDQGALRVLNEVGAEVVRMGKLIDGTYGFNGRVVGSTITGSAITGGTIEGGAITGGTIEGVTISGSTILVMSGPTIVARLDTAGLWLTDPATGALVLIGAHIFGSKTNTGSSSQTGSQAANSTSGWQDLPGSAPTVLSSTGRFELSTRANMGFVGTGNSANFQVRGILQAGGTVYPGVPLTMPGGLTSMAQQLTLSAPSDVAVPVGVSCQVKHQYNVTSGIASISDWIVQNYRTSATPN